MGPRNREAGALFCWEGKEKEAPRGGGRRKEERESCGDDEAARDDGGDYYFTGNGQAKGGFCES